MDIEERLTAEHSKRLTMEIVNYIGSDKKRFDTLMQIFLKGEYRLTQRASWPLSYVAIANPILIKSYFNKLILKLKQTDNHPSIPRNILRTFQEIDIPEKYHGDLVDICFAYILNQSQATGIRAFAISVACKVCMPYPELKKELSLILTDLNQFPQLPAVRHRLKVALKELSKSSV
jgi:hypothetical protein